MNNFEHTNILLSGGGGEKDTFALDGFFFKSIPQGGKVIYIPIALRGHKLFSGAPDWFKNLCTLHNRQDVEVIVWTSFKEADFSLLNNIDAVYVGGGNTWSLSKEIFESGFHNSLKKYIENGGLYYGGSAGAIICGARIDTQNDLNEVEWSKTSGLNVLNGYSVLPHAKEEKMEEYEGVQASINTPLIVLGEAAGLHVFGSKHTCFGEDVCKTIS